MPLVSRACVALVLLLVAAPLRAQEEGEVTVEASLEPRRIAVGGTAVLRVEVMVDGGEAPEVRLPPIPEGLQSLGTSQSSQLDVRFPGGIARRASFTVRLVGVREGEYRLSPAVAEAGGRTARSDPLFITVQAGGGSGPPLPAPAGPDDDILLQARLESDTVFVGEPVTLTGEAWLSAEARRQLRRAPQYVAPSPPSFWIHDFEGMGRSRPAFLGSRRYEVQTFRRSYVPITAGDFTMEPARLEVELRRGLLDPFQPRTLSTDSLRLTVLPLPAEDRPEGFAGAVGEYGASATVGASEVTRGDAVTLQVIVEGRGYVKALPPPRLPPLEGVEVFPPSERAEVRAWDGAPGGRKTFTWVIVPEREGTLRIPAIEYPFFDPDSAAYGVASTTPLEVRVAPGAVAAADPGGLRPLRDRPGRSRLEWVESPWFAAAQLLPLLGIAGALGARIRRRRSERFPRAELRRRRKELLRALHDMREEVGGVGRLPGLLRGWLAWRLGDPALASAAPSALAGAVRAAGVPGPAAHKLERIVRDAEAARFSPEGAAPDPGRRLAAEAAEVVRVVDRSAARPLRAPTPAAGGEPRSATARSLAGVSVAALGLALAAFAAAGSAGAAQRAEDERAFTRGVEAYRSGSFAAAAESFVRYVRARPDDAAGWYDLGLALHAQGRRGAAAWSWLQALGRAPRDGDARANLLAVGTPVRLLAEARQRLPLDRREHVLAGSVLWLVAGWALALTLLGGGRGWGIGGGAALALAAWLAAQGLLARPGENLAVALPPTLELRAEPARGGAAVGRLTEGAGLRLLDRRGDWRRVVSLEDEGVEGWAPRAAVAPLGPAGRPAPAGPLAAPPAPR